MKGKYINMIEIHCINFSNSKILFKNINHQKHEIYLLYFSKDKPKMIVLLLARKKISTSIETIIKY